MQNRKFIEWKIKHFLFVLWHVHFFFYLSDTLALIKAVARQERLSGQKINEGQKSLCEWLFFPVSIKLPQPLSASLYYPLTPTTALYLPVPLSNSLYRPLPPCTTLLDALD